MKTKKKLIYLEDALDLIRDALENGDRDLELAVSLLKVLASHGGAVDVVRCKNCGHIILDDEGKVRESVYDEELDDNCHEQKA